MTAKLSIELSLDANLVKRAEKFDLDLSEAASDGISQRVQAAEKAAWEARNRDAIASFNRYIELHGTVGEDERRYG
jgi:post-segregation antitoxin (ccd killing protein)